MNALERYNGMLAGERVDFLPRVPILMQFAAAYIGAPYGEFCSDYRVKVRGNLSCVKDFGVDVVSVMSDPYCETEGFGAKIEFVDQGTPKCLDPPLEKSTDLRQLEKPDPLRSKRMLNTINTVRA